MVSKQENCLPHITGLTFPGTSAFPTQEEKDQMAAEVSQPPTCPPAPRLPGPLPRPQIRFHPPSPCPSLWQSGLRLGTGGRHTTPFTVS